MGQEWILWRRLDRPGHDACRLIHQASGWRLEGSAAFLHENGAAASVAYEVECDREWRTRTGVVRGWVGERLVDLRLCREPEGRWRLGDRLVPELEECVDLDLGFTPATNLFQLQRMALEVGQAADISVAWLDVPDGRLAVLRQRYARRSIEGYWYEAPQFAYAALLHVNAAGFVVKYPGLWDAELADHPPGTPGETATRRD